MMSNYVCNVRMFRLLILILPINFGYEVPLLGNCLAIPSFLQKFGSETPGGKIEISTHFQQLWNGAATVSIFVAAYSAGFASDILGRLLVIYIGCILCIVGVVVQSFAESAMTIFGGKLVSSLGFGLGHVLAPVFIAKIASDELRGACLTLINNMIVLGLILMLGRILAVPEAAVEQEHSGFQDEASYLDCFKGIVVMAYLAQQSDGSMFAAAYLSRVDPMAILIDVSFRQT
ncbi:hypothetical protein D7B24_002759 [Verticillium nonalfalfae]|uniref:Major facilitator superfamily (MFS) profile domain-containing protein n=1 Tax=Verticillium nonalfalfae TaxID=1051616 RepID=A0A3M9YH33_9PEZI|nr:uncharacterized protein D7B24_002759 [Verticillium nonalfalfae]RNJ59381.1 hypothetical protein D7B24_002759 [Verticillium nonalfalfae]